LTVRTSILTGGLPVLEHLALQWSSQSSQIFNVCQLSYTMLNKNTMIVMNFLWLNGGIWFSSWSGTYQPLQRRELMAM